MINEIQLDWYRQLEDLFRLLKKEEQEHFLVLSLNKNNEVINKDLIAIGTLDFTIIHPRDVFRAAIRNNASKIVLLHNHPSGNSNPSNQDIATTIELIKCGELLGIGVLDHLIFGEAKIFSFK